MNTANSDFKERLNRILERLIADDFLEGRGLGNEIPFYAFDYPPERELDVREHIRFLLTQIPKKRPDLRLAHVNLFELVIDHLEDRGVYDKAVEMQKKKGDRALLKALAAPLDAGRLARVFADQVRPDEQDLVLVSGVGSAYPLLRTHSLLNNLQHRMGHTPLVLFYPGKYDGQSLRLFGILPDKPYYRAFRLTD
jgi:erythromycin esterase-like protein